MAVADDSKTLGRARLDFAEEHDIDEFVEVLGKYERGEITPEVWRRFRLVRGTYGQRQDNVQMLRIKIPQGIVTASQMRAMAGVAARYSRGFCHVTTRQNIQYHFVLLSVVEEVMRELADEGSDDARSVRQLGAEHHWMPVRGNVRDRDLRCDAVRRGDDALLPAPPAIGRPAAGSSRSRSKGALKITRSHRFTTSAGALASSMAGRGSVSPSRAAHRSCRCQVTCSTTSSRSRRCSTSQRRLFVSSTASVTTSIRSGTG